MMSWRREWELVDESVYRARRTDERLWQQARLREPNIAGAWARGDFPWEATPGQYTITVQAMDTAGIPSPIVSPGMSRGTSTMLPSTMP